jgi:hypothetical protein
MPGGFMAGGVQYGMTFFIADRIKNMTGSAHA